MFKCLQYRVCIILAAFFCFAFSKEFSPGYIHRAHLRYVNACTIAVTAGYGECNGSYWAIPNNTEIEVQVSDLDSRQGFCYVYIDDEFSRYPIPSICANFSEPSFDQKRNGWYYGRDRCVGCVWIEEKSVAVQPFEYIGNDAYVVLNEPIDVIFTEEVVNEFYEIKTRRCMPVIGNGVYLWILGLPQNHGYRLAPSEVFWDKQYQWVDVTEYTWIDVPIGMSQNVVLSNKSMNKKFIEIAVMGFRIKRTLRN